VISRAETKTNTAKLSTLLFVIFPPCSSLLVCLGPLLPDNRYRGHAPLIPSC